MKSQLLVPLLILALAYGCRTERAVAPPAPLLTDVLSSEVGAVPVPQLDSAVSQNDKEIAPLQTEKKGLAKVVNAVFGKSKQKNSTVATQSVSTSGRVKYKNTTIVVQHGTGNSAAVVGKKAGPTATGQEANAQDTDVKKGNYAAPGSNIADTDGGAGAAGQGARAEGGQVVSKETFWSVAGRYAFLAGGVLIGIVLLGVIIYIAVTQFRA